VRRCKDALLELLAAGCLDIVFANEEEAAELARQLGLVPSPPQAAALGALYCTHEGRRGRAGGISASSSVSKCTL
jgi:hypothetical protein